MSFWLTKLITGQTTRHTNHALSDTAHNTSGNENIFGHDGQYTEEEANASQSLCSWELKARLRFLTRTQNFTRCARDDSNRWSAMCLLNH